MPTYDYRCSACKHEFEKLQSFSEKPVKKCPKCGKAAAKRLIGAGGGIIFKGSGFYQTDYKKSSVPPAKTKDSSDAACKKSSGDPKPKTSSKD